MNSADKNSKPVVDKSLKGIDESLIRRLRENFRGRLVRTGEADYDAARKVWNGMIDKRPSIIAYCLDKADVIHSVNFARANGVLVSIRSGGHNVAGNAVCDNGMVIDLSCMKKIEISPSSAV